MPDFRDVVDRLLQLRGRAVDDHDLVVTLAEPVHADQQVVHAGVFQLPALVDVGEYLAVGDERRFQADLVAVPHEIRDVAIDRRLAALDVHRVVAVDVDQRLAHLLQLLERQEVVLGMIPVHDLVEEVAEVAAQVARLPDPEHASPAQSPVRGQGIPVSFDHDRRGRRQRHVNLLHGPQMNPPCVLRSCTRDGDGPPTWCR